VYLKHVRLASGARSKEPGILKGRGDRRPLRPVWRQRTTLTLKRCGSTPTILKRQGRGRRPTPTKGGVNAPPLEPCVFYCCVIEASQVGMDVFQRPQ